MDITVKREALLKPLQAASSVVEKKQTLPILSNVLLVVQEGRLFLTATDLEIELVGFVPLDAQKAEGSTTVSARKLFDICRALPENVLIHLVIEKNYLIVRSGESCFMLNTLPALDFPKLDKLENPAQLTVKQALLKDLFSKTYFAMGQQDVRHYLNGTLLEISSHTIKCVAADGHRLAFTSIQDEGIQNVETKVIIPRKSVLELMRLMNQDGMATLSIADNRITFATDDFIFTSKLISAQYPDYTRLIPRGTTVAIGEREAIKQALTRASILSNEKFRGVRFQLEPSKLRISSNNADQEQAEDVVALDYKGAAIEIGFNVAYLLDVVTAMTTKTLRCVFTDPNSGVLIEPSEDDPSLYVVMPMRL